MGQVQIGKRFVPDTVVLGDTSVGDILVQHFYRRYDLPVDKATITAERNAQGKWLVTVEKREKK